MTFNFILLFLSIFLVLFLPGLVLLLTCKKKLKLNSLEIFVFSGTFSYAISTFILIIIGRFSIPLSRLNIFLAISLFSLVVFAVNFLKNRKTKEVEIEKEVPIDPKKNAAFLLILILALTFRFIFLLPQIIPYSTDLGHHMYWVEKIVETEKLPQYEKVDIDQSEENYYIQKNIPISDFIIGEHLVFAAIKSLSRAEINSSFSIIILSIIGLLGTLTTYILALRIFEKETRKYEIALLAFFFISILYVLDPPQMKYIIGGVIGNTVGNLMLLTATVFILLALKKKTVIHIIFAVLATAGAVYIHHLSTFLFGVMIIFSFLYLFLVNIKNLKNFFSSISFIWKSPLFYFSLLLFILFFFFLQTPSYISNKAVETVIGKPTSLEHLGLSFSQFKYQLGEPRAIFGFFGFIILLFLKKFRKNEAMALLFGWIAPLLLFSLFPGLVKIDIPSGRAANYLIFPFSITAAYALIWIFEKIKNQIYFSKNIKYLIIIFFIATAAHNGIYDNVEQISFIEKNYQKILSVFSVSKFLVEKTPENENVIHDHINVLGDSWIKVFFMKEYNYPFYRANLFRYERATDKQENCTLDIISSPDSENSKKCLNDLDISTILVNKITDSQPFKKSENFSQIYSDQFNNVYYYDKADE